MRFARSVLALLLLAAVHTLPVAAQVPPPCGLGGCPGVTVTAAPAGFGVTAKTPGLAARFIVANGSSVANETFSTPTVTGQVTVDSVRPASLSMDAHETDTVTAWFSSHTATVNSAQITLAASGTYSSQATAIISIGGISPIQFLAPSADTATRVVVHNRQPVFRALLDATVTDSTRTVVTWRGDTVTQLARVNHALLEWEVDSAHRLGVGDSAQFAVTECTYDVTCTTRSRWVVLPADSQPVVDFTGKPFETLSTGFSSPFGPGFGLSGADVETGFSTIPYFSISAARSAGLVYSTRTSYPRALVPVNVELPWPTGTPTQLKLVLFDGATRLDSLVVASPSCITGSVHTCRAVLQGDFSASTFSAPTRKWLTVQVSVTASSTTKTTTDSAEVVLVDRRATPYGAGWWPSAYSKLVGSGNDRIIVAPNGAATIYRGNNDLAYLPPPGGTTQLVKAGTGWELHPRATTAKVVFDASGRLRRTVDQNGNRDSLAFSGSTDQLDSILDPLGKVIRFTYSGAGKLTTITSLYGATGARATAVTIDTATNQLTYDSLSTPTSRPATTKYVYQSYGSNKTQLILKRIGVLADTTVLVYDSTFKRRPTQVKLPATPDTTSTPVTATISYTAYEKQGFGTLRSRDSVYVEMKDPRSNWTRSLLNRWGEALQSWDSLGTIGKATYTPEGLALTAEGKNGDSSRVYTAYDSRKRVTKTYITRSSTDTLRVDSLAYDDSDRVVRRVDSRGRISSVTYDFNGNVQTVTDPSGNVSVTLYQANGEPDSVWATGDSLAEARTYEPTWRNLAARHDPGGVLADSVLYDAYGRDTLHLSKVRVQTTGTSTAWQWRKSVTFYNVANQVDSAITVRTNNCADPCASPGTWPGYTDTLHTQRVDWRYDRAGRDSLRLSYTATRTVATEYIYDRLGRLIRRRPWTDSTAVRDSMTYDVAGNVAKLSTRRGLVITHAYDSRNRDTLTVIPGLGNLHHAYGGPQDQVTRLWYTGYVDSIGGVDPSHAWVYDQRGRLVADTGSWAAKPWTTYTYDTYERPSTVHDGSGIWTTRYETLRGIPDTVITPFGDTLTSHFDTQGRSDTALVRGGVGGIRTTLAFSAAGDLAQMVQTDSGSVNAGTWTAGTWDGDNDGLMLQPTWSSTHDGTFSDSTTYDGWGRVVGWVFNGGADTRTYAFDRAGNLVAATSTAGSTDSFTVDGVTQRLLQRTTGGSASTYLYDRAGNLVRAISGAHDTLTYTYDPLERLSAVRLGGTLIARYAYDVLGNRIVKRVYSSATGGTVGYIRFFYHGAQVAFEGDSAGTLTWQYVWGAGVDHLIAARDSAGNEYYAATDLLGSLRGWYTKSGSWVMGERYEPYGTQTASSGTDLGLSYRWTGREYDAETGFYYLRARYYSPADRRFVQEDPTGYGGGSNLYAYVGGAVFSATDPSGMQAMAARLDPALYASYRDAERLYLGVDERIDGLNDWADGAASFLDELMHKDDTVSVTVAANGNTEVITFIGGKPTTNSCDVCKDLPDGKTYYAGIGVMGFHQGDVIERGYYVDSDGWGQYREIAMTDQDAFGVFAAAGMSSDFQDRHLVNGVSSWLNYASTMTYSSNGVIVGAEARRGFGANMEPVERVSYSSYTVGIRGGYWD